MLSTRATVRSCMLCHQSYVGVSVLAANQAKHSFQHISVSRQLLPPKRIAAQYHESMGTDSLMWCSTEKYSQSQSFSIFCASIQQQPPHRVGTCVASHSTNDSVAKARTMPSRRRSSTQRPLTKFSSACAQICF